MATRPSVPPTTRTKEGTDDDDGFRIGPFVLETLTTGLYEESSNALREYVQNAYDATRLATAAGLLATGKGNVFVTLPGDDTLVIEDNGIGLSKRAAWSTLTAIGASKKDRARDAGFCGIGRLAAIAFCRELSFRTKVAGEDLETIVTFDCVALREEMKSVSPVSLTELLADAVSREFVAVDDVDDHYMVVTLTGIADAPEELRSMDDIRAYLAETSPVAFDPKWSRAQEIVGAARTAGMPIETINLFVGRTREKALAVYKAYGDYYRKARGKAKATGGTTPLDRVQYHSGDHWWSWIGIPRDSGLLAEGPTNGLRVRVKNIQVDGTDILDRLFAAVNESYARFNKFHVGEIHVDPVAVIPNARRDGFEQEPGWDAIRKEIYQKVCDPLRQEAYQRSEQGGKTVERVRARVARLRKEIDRQARKEGTRTKTEWATALAKVEKVRSQVTEAVMEADPEANLALRVELDIVQGIKDRLEDNLEPDAERRLRNEIRKELVAKVEAVLQPYLDTATYQRVRTLLHERVR